MKIDQVYELVELDGDIDILKPHPQNPNKGDDDVVEESVDVNGWYGAIIAQKSTGYVLAGHTRLRAAIKKGAKQVPVIWRDVDDETALRILLVDNESARRATMDYDVVGRILDSLGDIRGTGVSPEEATGGSAAGEGAEAPEPTTPEDEAALRAITALEAEEEAEEALPGPDGVPDDVYTPQYGVMLVLESEEQQAAVYEWLAGQVDSGQSPAPPQTKLRVIAV